MVTTVGSATTPYADSPGFKYNPSTGNLTIPNYFKGTATTALYADLAENYLADDIYPSGTVLIFGGIAEVTKSNSDMSTRVAGVVSTNPAYLMNAEVEGGGRVATVALQGRVPAMVEGNINKGDMLVSTSNGTARAESSPAVGSVIGKSLEDFTGDFGIIEIAVGRD